MISQASKLPNTELMLFERSKYNDQTALWIFRRDHMMAKLHILEKYEFSDYEIGREVRELRKYIAEGDDLLWQSQLSLGCFFPRQKRTP